MKQVTVSIPREDLEGDSTRGGRAGHVGLQTLLALDRGTRLAIFNPVELGPRICSIADG